MSDIKERLRTGCHTTDTLEDCCDYQLLCDDAADHIAQLEKSRESLIEQRDYWHGLYAKELDSK